jgi:hypothetical protein
MLLGLFSLPPCCCISGDDQPTLLPSDGASKLQLLSALILECAPAASLLHP